MYDVIIVGARCAGSALGLLLADRGHRVLLVDRAKFPSDMLQSTHLIHQRGIACLARWGLRDEVAATASQPITRCEIDFGTFTISACPPPVDGEACGFAPRRILLDEILVRAALRNGAELRERCKVNALVMENGRVMGVRGVTSNGTVFAERARLVVGADGPSSRVAAEVKASAYNAKPPLQGTAWIYWSDVPLDHFELHLRDYEAIYAFPSSHQSTLIGANWSIERFRAYRREMEASYFELLRRAAPALAERVATARRADETIHLGCTRNYFRKACGPGWALVGDAHYKKDPCTAQGICDAFCDAELLAATIDQGLRGERDMLEGLEAYERERVAWSMPFYEMTCELATFAPPPPQMLALYAALQDNQDDAEAFMGVVTEAVPPSRFFNPENIEQILGQSAAPGH